MKIRMLSQYAKGVEFYKDEAKDWRWKVTAPNGRQIGASSEGYKNKIDCEDNFQLLSATMKYYVYAVGWSGYINKDEGDENRDW